MQRCVIFLFICITSVLTVLITAGPSSAESVFDRYMMGGHFALELSGDTITDTSKFEFELELRMRGDGFSAFIRGSNDRPFSYQTEPFELEKRGFNFELNDDWEVSGGHYSLIFGRGSALNAVENRDVDHDAQLDGVMVEGELGCAELTAFWGRHKSDHMEYYLSGVNTNNGGPTDGLRGGRIEFDFDDLDIGGSWVDAEMTRWDEMSNTRVLEADVSAKLDNVRMYYETVWFNRDEPEGVDKSMDGRAQLYEMIYSEPGCSIAGSWVRYDMAHFDYGTVPSLRRPDIDDAKARADDETGYRVDCHFSPSEWSGNSLRVLYSDLNGIENKDQEFKNYFVEWSSPVTRDWSGTFSYDRITGFQQYYGAVDGTDMNYRGTLDGPFCGGGSFHLYCRYRLLRSEYESDEEMEIGFDWHISSDFTLGFFRETSTRPMEPPPPGMMIVPGESPGHWDSAFVRWTPDPSSQVELLVGSRRGGFQCAGGTCAQVPPFKGVMFTYYRNF